MSMKQNSVMIKKESLGGLTLELPDYYGEKPSRIFRWNHNTPELAVPFNYAASLYANYDLKGFLLNGYIECAGNKEAFFQLLEAEGLIETQKQVVAVQEKLLTASQLLAVLKADDVDKVAELYAGVNAKRLQEVIVANKNQLTMKMLTYLEGLTGMALIIEGN